LTAIVSVSCSRSERQAFIDEANRAGVTPAAWARGVLVQAVAHRMLEQQAELVTLDRLFGSAADAVADIVSGVCPLCGQPQARHMPDTPGARACVLRPASAEPQPLAARQVPVRPMGPRCACGEPVSYRQRPSSGQLEACCAKCRVWL